MWLALDKRTRTPAFRVIPVLLPNTQMPEKGPLPDFLRRVTWVDFRGGLDDADALHRLVSGIKGIAPGPTVPSPGQPSPPLEADICPYLGLETFQEKDAEFFFGRAALTQRLSGNYCLINQSLSNLQKHGKQPLVQQVRSWPCPAYDLKGSVIKALFPDSLSVAGGKAAGTSLSCGDRSLRQWQIFSGTRWSAPGTATGRVTG
jgi:hypothetical protein